VTAWETIHAGVSEMPAFFDGGERVPNVQPVEVDVVGAKSLETRVDRPDDALSMSTAGVRVVLRTHVEPVLGCHDAVVAVRRDQLTDDPLARPIGVAIGGVDEVAAGLAEGVEDPGRQSSETRRPVRPSSL
jgi:hypothetical protein